MTKWNACFNLCSKAQNKCKVTWDQAPHWGERAKKIGERSKPRGNLWRGKGGEPGDMPLMPPICPPVINLSLTCQYVMFSSWMPA